MPTAAGASVRVNTAPTEEQGLHDYHEQVEAGRAQGWDDDGGSEELWDGDVIVVSGCRFLDAIHEHCNEINLCRGFCVSAVEYDINGSICVRMGIIAEHPLPLEYLFAIGLYKGRVLVLEMLLENIDLSVIKKVAVGTLG